METNFTKSSAITKPYKPTKRLFRSIKKTQMPISGVEQLSLSRVTMAGLSKTATKHSKSTLNKPVFMIFPRNGGVVKA